jgi:CHASE1-domain containing sensor protein
MRSLVARLALVSALAAMPMAAYAQQQQQINNQANIGQHAAAAAAKGGGDEKVKANDKAYNAALKNLPDKQYDPWRGVR